MVVFPGTMEFGNIHRGLVTEEQTVSDNMRGLYFSIPVYFVVLGIAAFVSYRRMHKQIMEGSTD